MTFQHQYFKLFLCFSIPKNFYTLGQCTIERWVRPYLLLLLVRERSGQKGQDDRITASRSQLLDFSYGERKKCGYWGFRNWFTKNWSFSVPFILLCVLLGVLEPQIEYWLLKGNFQFSLCTSHWYGTAYYFEINIFALFIFIYNNSHK